MSSEVYKCTGTCADGRGHVMDHVYTIGQHTVDTR